MGSPNTKRKVKKEGVDLYNTPMRALEGFYDNYPEVFDTYNIYYDPCNGLGKISNYLKGLGKKVYTSDINQYGYEDYVVDFLEMSDVPDDVECIIFNPPFLLTKEFVDHAIKLCKESKNCKNILMFNRLTTLESKDRARKFKTNEWPLKNCYVFGYRVSCTEGEDEKPTANSVSYCWHEFDVRRKTSEPTLRWII